MPKKASTAQVYKNRWQQHWQGPCGFSTNCQVCQHCTVVQVEKEPKAEFHNFIIVLSCKAGESCLPFTEEDDMEQCSATTMKNIVQLWMSNQPVFGSKSGFRTILALNTMVATWRQLIALFTKTPRSLNMIIMISSASFDKEEKTWENSFCVVQLFTDFLQRPDLLARH